MMKLDRLILTVDNLGNKKTFSYDSRNRLIKIIDQLGNVKHLEYDVYGRKIREILQVTETGLGSSFPIGTADMSFGYDANDNLILQIDAKGNRLIQSFDSLDRLAIVGYPDGSTTEIRYDENENVKLTIDNNGLAVRRSVDDLNRTVRIDLDRSNLLTGIVIDGESFEEFTYDGLGRVTGDRNDHINNVRKFDSLGRCYSESTTISITSMQMPSVYTIFREFDEMGFPSKITYPSGRIIRYELDGLNRITKIENLAKGTSYPGSGSIQNQYEIMRIVYRGLLRAKLLFGNDTSIELAYDAEKRPIQTIHTKNNEAPYIILQQLHDGVGNVRMKTEVSPRTKEGESYKYNSFYWLTERKRRISQQFDPTQFEPRRALQDEEDLDLQNRINNEIGPLEQTSRDATYEYDLVGNRSSSRETAEPSSYLSNNLNQYVTADQVALRYDFNGNLVNDGKWQFFYDYRNRLVRIRDVNQATDITKFIHDAQGRRIISIDRPATTISIHDGPNIIEEHIENQLYAQYVHEYRLIAYVKLQQKETNIGITKTLLAHLVY